MSRTDKDDPFFMRAMWYTPYHRCGWYRQIYCTCEYDVCSLLQRCPNPKIRWHFLGECTLPDNPVRKRALRGRKVAKTCDWFPAWYGTRYELALLRGKSVKLYRRIMVNKPRRARERDAIRRVIKGDYDAEFPDSRERHSLRWMLN